MTEATTTFEPPGGGWWEHETVHTRGAVPVAFQELFPAAMRAGMQAVTAAYGLPISHIEIAFVGHHCYGRPVPVGAPPPKVGRVSSAPPPTVLRALARLHPELRRRRRAAAAALWEHRWEADRARWEAEIRPARLATDRTLQAVDVAELTGAGLADHLEACIENAAAGTREHFELLGAYNVPVGRFVGRCRSWGIDDRDALDLLGGCSPGSSVLPALQAVAAACAAVGAEPTSFAAIRSASPDAAAALDALLAEHGCRVVDDYTPRGATLAEVPGLVLGSLRRAPAVLVRPTPDASVVRDQVPVADRSAFDALLDGARAAAGVRDDNVGPCFMWPMGLLRRALLEIGRRLVAAGSAREPADSMWLPSTTLTGWLRGTASIGSDQLRAAVEEVARLEAEGAPAALGWREGGPPDLALFGPAVAEVAGAFLLVLDLELPQLSFGVEAGDRGFSGVGVGARPYRGRAVVAATVEDAVERLEPGDVLVTTLTTPAYNVVLPMCGGVVTEQGGVLSHTALVARELDLPAVCGVAGACTRIPDGAEVEVDPMLGEVRLLAGSTSEGT